MITFAYIKYYLYLCAQFAKKHFLQTLYSITTMKLNKIFAAFMLIAAVAFTACNQNPPVVGPDGSDDGKDTTQIPTDTTQIPTDTTTIPDTDKGIDYLDGEISVAQALEQAANLAGGDTIFGLKVRGIVKSVEKVDLGYGSAQFYITDDYQNELYCYGIKGVNGEALVSAEQVAVGDTVTVDAPLYHYVKADGTQDVLELVKGQLTRTTNTFDPSQVTGPKEISVAEALALGSALEAGATTSEQYKISGIVGEVTDASTQYGNLTFYLEGEDGSSILCFRLRYIDGAKYTENDPALNSGDVVTVIGQIQNYKGEKIEVVSGSLTEHIY